MKFLALFLSLATACQAAFVNADRVMFPSAPAAVTNAPSLFPANSFLGFVVTGQSLANGSGSGMNLSTTPNPTIYTQGNGAPVPFGDNPVTAGLAPCTESYYQTETITTSSMQQARALGVQQSMGSLVAAASGQPYYGWLDPGTAVWTLNQQWISNCVTYATNPVVIFPAWFIVHGEANASDTSYTNTLLDWCKSATTNCRSITGQTNIVKIFSSQMSSFNSRGGAVSDLAMLQVSQVAGHSNITVCAKYMLQSDQTNSPHLAAIGYQRLGEYYGKAFHDEFYSNSFSPLIITNATRNGSTITASFGGCIGGLSVDTNTVPFISNYGIVVDGYTVTNVVVTNGNQIFIQLSTTTSGSCTLNCAMDVTGSSPSWVGNGGGSTLLPDIQARSNIRDNDPRVGFLSGSNLWNWPVHHQFTVP